MSGLDGSESLPATFADGTVAGAPAPTMHRPPPFRIVGDRAALFTALAKARAEFPSLDTSRTVEVETRAGPKYTFDYADLAASQAATVPALSKHGLVISQPWWQEGDGFVLLTILAHESGASMETETYFVEDGNKQALGSALTYLQRYQWRSVCGISASKDDDDGSQAVGNRAVVTPRQTPSRIPPTAGATPDPLMVEITDLARKLDFSKAQALVFMKEKCKLTKQVEFLTPEEAGRFIVAMTDELAHRDVKGKIK